MLQEARKLALQGKNAFPSSIGGKLCHNLVQTIEDKQFDVQIERVWALPYARMHINYRNINKLHFRAYKSDWASRITNVNSRPELLALFVAAAKKPGQ